MSATGGFANEVTERVFWWVVDNEPRHDRLLRTIDGRDPAGGLQDIEDYLRDATASGDPRLVGALAGDSIDRVNVAQVAAACRGYPRAAP